MNILFICTSNNDYAILELKVTYVCNHKMGVTGFDGGEKEVCSGIGCRLIRFINTGKQFFKWQGNSYARSYSCNGRRCYRDA